MATFNEDVHWLFTYVYSGFLRSILTDRAHKGDGRASRVTTTVRRRLGTEPRRCLRRGPRVAAGEWATPAAGERATPSGVD
jgi:hypothetical protein